MKATMAGLGGMAAACLLLAPTFGCSKPTTPSATPKPAPPTAQSTGQPPAQGGGVALPGNATGTSRPACQRYGAAVESGRITSDKLREISGLAASGLHRGVLWGHNDAGKSKARLFAISTTGRHLSTWKLKGVDPVDTEDVAVAPCAALGPRALYSCIYLGDVGDNEHKRDYVAVYRVQEPHTLPPMAAAGERAPVERFKKKKVTHLRLRYPKASQVSARLRARAERPNSEAMVVLRDTRMVMITKRNDGIARVFRAAPDPAGIALAKPLGTLELRVPPGNADTASPATGADLTADGRWLAVRTYARLFVFDTAGALRAPPAQARAMLARATRIEVKAGYDSQGEAVCWARRGGLWHASESVNKRVNVPLWRIRCAP